MVECKFCNGELDKFLIKKFNYWTIYLNKNQSYLGRVYVVLNRHGPEDTIGLTEEEWKELKVVEDKVTNALKLLYNPDLMNYLTIQTKDRNHFHVHIFPDMKIRNRFIIKSLAMNCGEKLQYHLLKKNWMEKH